MKPEAPRARAILLRCQACHAALPAASHDVAFRCPQCGRAWEIEAGSLAERPSLFVMPPHGATHPILFLPYWSFTLTTAAKARNLAEAGQLLARDRAARLQRAFVSAYSIYRPTYVGEWGLTYTRALPRWETRRGRGPEAPGATLTSVEARKIAEHYVLAEIDRAADLGNLDVQLAVSEPELWAIPCFDLGTHLRCPWTRAELPSVAIDDLSELRRTDRRLEA